MKITFATSCVSAALGFVFLVCTQVQAATEIRRVTYLGMPAYRLSDGKTETVVVPMIGRIMCYGKVGGANLLWNTRQRTWKPGDWKNYGGEKNWLAPQSSWAEFHGKDGWPPDPVLDGAPYQAQVVAPGVLQLRSRVTPGAGIGLRLRLSFAMNGDFVLKLSGAKKLGPVVRAGLWSNTQIVPGSAVFLPANPHSAYKQGYLNMMGSGTTAEVQPDLIRVDPNVKSSCKLGVDANVSAIVSVADGVAFLVSTPKRPGLYPDGYDTDGMPVELYINSDKQNSYCELELLGPLVHANTGSVWSMTIHWSLHDIPQNATSGPEITEMARRLLYGV